MRIPAELAYERAELDAEIERVGDEIRILATRDRKRDALDKLIAAHAVCLDAALVTNCEADFVGYPGLRVENWIGVD